MECATDLPTDLSPRFDLSTAFAGNRLLAMLDDEVRALLEPHAQVLTLKAGVSVFKAGAPVDRTVFPFDSLTVSMMVETRLGRSVEVATIGKEGAIGGIVSGGAAPAFSHSAVQIAGSAVAFPSKVLESTTPIDPPSASVLPLCRFPAGQRNAIGRLQCLSPD